MNPTKNLIEPKHYMNPTKNLIEPKLYMVYIKIEMSMIKYYHKYILFKCYYSFKMALGIFLLLFV